MEGGARFGYDLNCEEKERSDRYGSNYSQATSRRDSL
jgi:hypothetical protein